MFLLRAVLNILVRNASPRGPMCFRWLIFNVSEPCELLFLLCFMGVCSPYVISLCDFAYYVFRAKACNCYTSCPLVSCVCLPSVRYL